MLRYTFFTPPFDVAYSKYHVITNVSRNLFHNSFPTAYIPLSYPCVFLFSTYMPLLTKLLKEVFRCYVILDSLSNYSECLIICPQCDLMLLILSLDEKFSSELRVRHSLRSIAHSNYQCIVVFANDACIEGFKLFNPCHCYCC